MAQSYSGVLVAGGTLGTEWAHRWFLLLVSIWLCFLAFVWAPIMWLYFMDDSVLVLRGGGGEACLLFSSSYLLLGYTEPYQQEGRYLSVVPEEVSECWFL